ncbi:hypothetical protein EC968_002631 [Mortierella alpina]|nr:hypothetical protein EC968_002631 [Mortierella alpina]
MLVHGGMPNNGHNSVGRTFAINLTTNWNTSLPDITALRDDFQGYNIASALSSDNKTWFMMANANQHRFHIGNGTWSRDPSSSIFTERGGLGAATNPETGLIYILNGLSNIGSYSMRQYSLTTGSSNSIPMEPTMVNVSDSAVVWSTIRKSMLVHGGWSSTPATFLHGLYEFVPDGGNGEWKLLLDMGDIPERRKGHCLVPAYGGSKMILFGGQTASGASSHIYSLDVRTLTWTTLTDPGERYGRAYHACAVSNDMFVSWGGSYDGQNATSNNVTLVYNLKSNVWQTTFSPRPEDGEGAPPHSSLVLAAIIGIVVGIIVILLLVGCVIYRQKHHQSELASDHPPGGGNSNSNNPRTSMQKDALLSLQSLSLKPGSDDGTEYGHLMAAEGVQYKQVHAHQRKSSLSHRSVDAPAITQQQYYYGASDSKVGAEGDETIHRPSEIIYRGPHAVIDRSEYKDCKSTARGPQTIQ